MRPYSTTTTSTTTPAASTVPATAASACGTRRRSSHATKGWTVNASTSATTHGTSSSRIT